MSIKEKGIVCMCIRLSVDKTQVLPSMGASPAKSTPKNGLSGFVLHCCPYAIDLCTVAGFRWTDLLAVGEKLEFVPFID